MARKFFQLSTRSEDEELKQEVYDFLDQYKRAHRGHRGIHSAFDALVDIIRKEKAATETEQPK